MDGANKSTDFEEHMAKNDLKINRWVFLVMYTLVSCLTGLLHGGFSEWQPIIYKTGAFSYLCNENDSKKFIVDNNTSFNSCDERDKTVNDLSTISFAVQFAASPLSGYILDKFGAKTCYFYGQATILTAFAILAIFGNYSFIWQVFFFLLGFSTDAAYLPLLQASQYFPGKESLVFGILGAARSSNFGLALLLKILFFYGPSLKENQFYILCIAYILTASLYAFAIGIFLIPRKKKPVCGIITETKESISNNSCDLKITEKEANVLSDEKTALENKNDKLEQWKQMAKRLWNHPQKWEYTIIVFICCMSVLRLNYYIKSNRSFFVYSGHNITTVFSISTIIAFIPAPFFGYLADKYGPLFVLIINNICILLSFLLLFLKPVVFRYLSIFFFFFFVSFCFSVFHCYVDKRYPKEHFGKLTGCMFVLSSLFLLFNFYLTYLTDVVFSYKKEENYYPVVTGLSIIGFIIVLLCFYLKKFKPSNATE